MQRPWQAALSLPDASGTQPSTQSSTFCFPPDDNHLFHHLKIAYLSSQMTQGLYRVENSITQLKQEFTDFGTRLERVEGSLNSVRSEVVLIDSRVNNLEILNKNFDSNDCILREFEDRMIRNSNFLIFGLPEAVNEDQLYNNDDLDNKSIKNLLTSVHEASVNYAESLLISRLGKFSQARSVPRSIKVNPSSGLLKFICGKALEIGEQTTAFRAVICLRQNSMAAARLPEYKEIDGRATGR